MASEGLCGSPSRMTAPINDKGLRHAKERIPRLINTLVVCQPAPVLLQTEEGEEAYHLKSLKMASLALPSQSDGSD